MGENEIKIAKLEANVEQIQKETAEIKTINEAVIKLTYIVEELRREREEALHYTEPSPPQPSFWDTKAGERIPLYITIVVCTVVIALVAQEKAVEVLKAIPLN